MRSGRGDDAGNSIVEHVAGIDDFEVAVATYWAAVARWPRARITLRQGAQPLVAKSASSAARQGEVAISEVA
jgi:hypothetical protein